MRSQVNDLVTVLITLKHIIFTTTLPVPTAGLGGLLGGISGLEQMLDDLRGLLPAEMWPDDAVCSFLSAKKVLTETADREEMVDQVFTKLGDAAADLGAVTPRPRAGAGRERGEVEDDALDHDPAPGRRGPSLRAASAHLGGQRGQAARPAREGAGDGQDLGGVGFV